MKELYRFVEGDKVWTLSSADQDSFYDSGFGDEVYFSSTIGRDEVTNKNELSKANLTVTVPISNEMARRWMSTVLDNIVTLTIFATDDVDTLVIWKGRLSSVKPEGASIRMIFESVATSLRRYGLRLKFQRSCPHVLYGVGCNLDKESFAMSAVVVSTDGLNVVVETASPSTPGVFIAGMLGTSDGVYRFITGHGSWTGSAPWRTTLTLFRPLDLDDALLNNGYGNNYGNNYGGLGIRLYYGCNRTKENCRLIFNNIANYGGFPYIPLINPFSGKRIV